MLFESLFVIQHVAALQAHFEETLEKNFPKSVVKLKRLRTRCGLIVARMEGLKLVTADTVSFFDSHMEVNKDWYVDFVSFR